MSFTTMNPANGTTLQEYQYMSGAQVEEILASTHETQNQWSALPLEQRLPYFTRLAQVLRYNKEKYARQMTIEMGKPISESLSEVEKCAWLCDYLVEHGPKWLEDKKLEADGENHVAVFDPLGVVFMIMPWNFPFWQPFKVALPPLMSGNGIVLKHARNVTGSSLFVEEAFREAGFPENLFRSIIIGHDLMPEIVASEHVHACSLTGSEFAGSKMAEQAGKQLKKVVLELGGSDPLIVLDDADIPFTVKGAVLGRFMNAGQVCISSKRIFVMESIYDDFVKEFVAQTQALTIGDPLEDHTKIGPLVNEKAVEEMEQFVQSAQDMGATLECGGKRHILGGAYFQPAVLSGVTMEMDVCSQEVFGPIAPIVKVKSIDEAIAYANDSQYGLGASIWAKDLQRAQEIARKIETGSVFINSIVKTHPGVPVGGIKKSGYGRELSEFGMLEFVNIKSVNTYKHG